MEIIVSQHHNCDRIEITGRIDSLTIPHFETVLKVLLNDDHYNIIVDLLNVNFISSSGMLNFVKHQHEFIRKNKGEIIFLHVPELIFKSFEMAGFNTIFKFFQDFDSAKIYFSRSVK